LFSHRLLSRSVNNRSSSYERNPSLAGRYQKKSGRALDQVDEERLEVLTMSKLLMKLFGKDGDSFAGEAFISLAKLGPSGPKLRISESRCRIVHCIGQRIFLERSLSAMVRRVDTVIIIMMR